MIVLLVMLSSTGFGQDRFVETFSGEGRHDTIQEWNPFTREFFGQELSGLDNPNWLILGDGAIEEGGYRFDLQPVEPDAGFDFIELAKFYRDVSIENEGSFIEHVEFKDVTVIDGETVVGSVVLGLTRVLSGLDNGNGSLQFLLTEQIDPDQDPDGYWDVSLFFGDRHRTVVSAGSHFALEMIFYNEEEPQVEFTYDETISDGIPAMRFGPFDYVGEVSDEQRTDVTVTANGYKSLARGILDFWSMRELSEFNEGDFDFDDTLGANDIDILSNDVRSGNNASIRDLTSDGLVDENDRTKWIVELANTYVGDSNLDGQFSSTDLVAVFQASEYEDDIEGNSTWATGDWNGDSEFDSSDLVLAFADGGYEMGPRFQAQSVPEPSNAVLLLPLLSLVWLRQFRQPYPTVVAVNDVPVLKTGDGESCTLIGSTLIAAVTVVVVFKPVNISQEVVTDPGANVNE